MTEWLIVLQCVVTIAVAVYIDRMDRTHRKEIERIHESYKEERTELLDRIMANNITEFKAARQDAQVKRSATGNFYKDAIQASMNNQYFDE